MKNEKVITSEEHFRNWKNSFKELFKMKNLLELDLEDFNKILEKFKAETKIEKHIKDQAVEFYTSFSFLLSYNVEKGAKRIKEFIKNLNSSSLESSEFYFMINLLLNIYVTSGCSSISTANAVERAELFYAFGFLFPN